MDRFDWKQWATSLRRSVHALYLAGRDRRVPLLAKLVIGLTVAYALSPIDLIPDFVPVLGYLDDLLLLPLGIWLAIRLIPPDVWQECQARAAASHVELPRRRGAALVIVAIWLLVLVAGGLWAYRLAAGTRG